MSRVSLRSLSALLIVLLPACGIEGEEFSSASFQEQVRAADAESTVSIDLVGEVKSVDADQACQEVTAIVCVGGVCTTMTATLCGNTLTVKLPVDRSLIGLPITAVVPGVGTFTGTYR